MLAPAAKSRDDSSARGPAEALSPPLPIESGKIDLGRDLFQDRRISRSVALSCASCHDIESNGATSRRFDRGDSGHELPFNTPTVFNSVHNYRLGWEGKTRTLHDFVSGTLGSEHVMRGRDLSAERLAADPRMLARFRMIYGTGPSRAAVADALASFMGTLVTPAPFDRWLQGDRKALTLQQVRGYERFKQVGCASCHQGVNLGANLFQRRGIFHPLGGKGPEHLRVPSLRNVAVTAPYFHDGHVASLPGAIRVMARSQLDLTLADQDVRDIAAFLQSLTGAYQGRQLRQAGVRE
ncbi:cytochrome-c peroxidase [Sphingomonas deserti]|uniref:Cytochrome-c peroxidase n=2 Tax=Allosphingosinicella deserti TaxID=2116704 RepID=A0A2P7QSS4_9SPHN|nr:cytochrome-c peroxidase [Sphingomonas deserti]